MSSLARFALLATAVFVLAGADRPADSLRGVLRAKDRISLAAAMAAPVESLPFGDGAAFRKGDILVRFDCARLTAEADAAAASHKAARIERAQKAHLRKLGAAGQGEVDIASAQAERSGAEAAAAAARAGDCLISAPFDGRVAELMIAVHEWPQPGKPMMVLVGDANLEIEMIAPSAWLSWIKPGAPFRFMIEETGGTAQGRILRIGAEVDPVSQTVRLTGGFDAKPEHALAGMSGTATFAAGAF